MLLGALHNQGAMCVKLCVCAWRQSGLKRAAVCVKMARHVQIKLRLLPLTGRCSSQDTECVVAIPGVHRATIPSYCTSVHVPSG